MPFTYLIGWSKLNKYYYGVRFARSCKPSDLWTTYFTSSNYVKEVRTINGEPDIIQVRRIFDNVKEARAWEHKVLRRLKANIKDKWINKTDNKTIIHDKETIEKMKRGLKKTMLKKYGVEYSSQRPEFAELVKQTKLKKYGNSNYVNMEKHKNTCIARYGVENYSQTEEAKERKKKTSFEKYGTTCPMNSPEIQAQIKQKNIQKYGVENYSQTEEAKERKKKTSFEKYGVQNHSQTERFRQFASSHFKKFWQNAPEILCPHCQKVFTNRGNYNRYHGDNCKQKLN